ncbi:restriction endonuclease subunit S [Arthrobacter sp. SDTb3-6]|uniref:restriction endonuclease subunit S n=1 Tax=Arthrobacter sp. SDTb3-6 TaxID=2713571 RepID=UPI00159D22B1|nr:restriction endonuclease subunit S [Arthrobacter sp. SDTb3-6]NVM99040.1 restriction endonuclease subunit S [Arthrobacter sp. SDTb3-6]
MTRKIVKIQDIAAPTARSIAIGPFGSNLKADLYTTSGVAVVRGQNIKASPYLDEEDLVFVSHETAEKLSSSMLNEGDLVFPHRGAIGRVGLVGERRMLLSSSMMKLTVDSSKADPKYVLYYFRGPGERELLMRASTVGTPGIGQPLTSLRGITIELPDLQQQQAIAEVLGALDDKIAANTKLGETSAQLSLTLFKQAVHEASDEFLLSDITSLLSRGVTPKYADGADTMMVLNQKCIRGQRVDLGPSRRTVTAKVRRDKVLLANDVLINSTGQGTLGRVARWTTEAITTVDSHVTIVRFDNSKVDPAVAGLGLMSLQDVIIEMGEGSTGQTELSRTELGKLRVRLPKLSDQARLSKRLVALTEMEHAHLAENLTLSATRDALLPQLMSGKLRVKDAESTISALV